MRILCTHPGRHGDLLWALPTVRALAHTYQCEIDLLLSPNYSSPSFRRLLIREPYIGEVMVAEDWAIQESAPITPREPPSHPSGYDHIVHLGYDGWPLKTLPLETYRIAGEQLDIGWPIDLDTPWLQPQPRLLLPPTQMTIGFTDEYFEVKYGVYWLLREHFITAGEDGTRILVNCSHGERWKGRSAETDWETAQAWISSSELFVGCCSALHVVACALGKPCVVVEPAEARHHPVFYPYGTTGPRVTVALGLTGQPTVDSRHVIAAIEARLQQGAAA